jgi:hypothetical protein
MGSSGALVSFDHDDTELGSLLQARESHARVPWAAADHLHDQESRGREDIPCTHRLDRQERFGPVQAQVGITRVDEHCQQAVAPQDQTQFHDSLTAQLLERRPEGSPADVMGSEEFPAIGHHRGLVRR